jgi:hypothetical protein
MRVKCPNCKAIMWKTTDKFDPDVRPNGAMLELLPPWKNNGWPVFGDGVLIASSTTLCAEMDCPQCLAQLAPSGRLTLVPDEEPVVEPGVEEGVEASDEVEGVVEQGVPAVEEEVVEEVVEKPKSKRRR